MSQGTCLWVLILSNLQGGQEKLDRVEVGPQCHRNDDAPKAGHGLGDVGDQDDEGQE